MAPIKIITRKKCSKLLGVLKDTDLSLRGHVQSKEKHRDPPVGTTATGTNRSDYDHL